MIRPLALACLFCLVATPALAQDDADASLWKPGDQEVMNTGGFLAAHPDIRWRREGLRSLELDRAGDAFAQFQRAARYADKPSQAMVAEMLWSGIGTPVDRPLAYAWMDLAAERAYRPFLAKRERYWNALSEAERAQALAVGKAVYEEYNDGVAKERLERLLRRAQRSVTGSRTGHAGNLRIILPGPDGINTYIDGAKFYDDQYWEPDQYWAWQDSVWKDPPKGVVSVLPLEVVPEAGEADDGD